MPDVRRDRQVLVAELAAEKLDPVASAVAVADAAVVALAESRQNEQDGILRQHPAYGAFTARYVAARGMYAADPTRIHGYMALPGLSERDWCELCLAWAEPAIEWRQPGQIEPEQWTRDHADQAWTEAGGE